MKNGKKVGGQFSEKQFSTADDVTLGASGAGSRSNWSADRIGSLDVVKPEWTVTLQNDDGSQVEIPDLGALDRKLGTGRERMAIPVKVQFEDGSTEQRMVGVEKHGPSGFRTLVPDELGEDDERFYHAVTEAAGAAYATTDEKSPGTLKAEKRREARNKRFDDMRDLLSDPADDASAPPREPARTSPAQGYFVGERYVPRFNAPVEPEISLFDKGLNVVARSGNPPFDPVAARRRRDEEAGREPRFPLNRADWDASRAAEASTKDEPMPKVPHEAAAAERQAARETAEREAAERARAQEVPAAKIGRFISRGLDKLKGV